MSTPQTFALPDGVGSYNLRPIEAVMPLIKRIFKVTGVPLSDVADIAASCLEKAGNQYGSDYVSVLPVEADGMVYLPLNCKRVQLVVQGPYDYDCYGGHGPQEWYPGLGITGRLWVADQVADQTAWRLSQFESLTAFPWPRNQQLPYQRVEEGLYIPHLSYHAGASRPTVIVRYEGQLVDSRGYVLLTDRDAEACAYLWNFERIQADFFSGVPAAGNMIGLAERQMHRYIGIARVGDGLTDQDLARILKVSATWDRASYATGFSPSL